MFQRSLAPALAILIFALPATAQDTHTTGVSISDSDGSSADLFVTDVSVLDGKVCIGNGCVDAETFGNEAVKMKAGVVGILFEDTSTGANFPKNDWKLVVNDDLANGEDKFAIADITGGTTPFTVMAGAPTNALFVAANGRVGLGTSLPQRDLHIVDGITAGIILESDGTGGFGANTWDINGSGESFRITELGVGTSFRIRTPSVLDTMVLRNGNVGINTFNPTEALHVKRSDGMAKILVEELGGSGAQELFQMKSNGGSYFTLSNTTSGRDWFFTHENNIGGRFIITSSTNPSQGLFYSPNGNMQIGGVLTENSDKHAKMAIEPVDTADILNKVAALPVSAWTYKDDAPGIRHVGPMAQDFYAAFGLGETETGISTLDTSGIALASIKALHDENEALTGKLAAQDTRLAAQNTRLAAQEAMLDLQRTELNAIKAMLAE
jgi:hypothetical protein